MTAMQNLVKIYQEEYPDQMKEPFVIHLSEIMGSVLNAYARLRDEGYYAEKGEEFYTPSRNLVFSTLTTMIGEIFTASGKYDELYVGLGIHKHTHKEEGGAYERDYWDITPEFADRLQHLLELNDNVKINIYAPYKDKYKKDIVEDVFRLNVPWDRTWTCYNPVQVGAKLFEPCRECEACIERQLAGNAAGVPEINDYAILVS